MNKRTIKWWEVSPSQDQNQAFCEEMNEIIDQYRWRKRNGYNEYQSWHNFCQDIKDFWEKYSTKEVAHE